MYNIYSPENNDSNTNCEQRPCRGQAPCREDHQFCAHYFLGQSMSHISIIHVYTMSKEMRLAKKKDWQTHFCF